jgi:hypothetical protein
MEIKHDGYILTGDQIMSAKNSGSQWFVWTRFGESRLVPSELMADAANIMDALKAFYVAGRINLIEKMNRAPVIYWEQCYPFLPPKPLLQPHPPSGKDGGIGSPP